MVLKRLERGWRALSLRGVIALMRMRRPGRPVPDWGARPHRVLFLRHDRIGDMIVSTGLLRTLTRAVPGLALDVLASPANAPALAGNPAVDRVLVMDKRRPWTYPALALRMRRRRYDVVLDCMVTAPSMTTILLMLASGARHRIGIAGRGVDAALTIPVPRQGSSPHIIDRLAALALPFGVDPAAADWRPHLALDEAHRSRAEEHWRRATTATATRRLLVNVSAGSPPRSWPEERFAEVLRYLRAAYPDVSMVVIGAPGERDRVGRIARGVGAAEAETPTLQDAAALVATAHYLFTPDTSIVHMASAFGTPTVAMYLWDACDQWGLYRTPGYEVASAGDTLDLLPVERVREALDDMLQGRMPADASTTLHARESLAGPAPPG